jgi:tripartite-type tricarboxylate transporter receptor subunit TctC
MRTRLSLFVVPLVGAAMSWSTSWAQSYPTKPITVVVPFAAGGPVDTDTRRYTARLSAILGQPIVIDYRPGAGTSIGAQQVARATPDGYTLLSNSSAFAVFPAFYKDLKFDPMKDLEPITMMHFIVSALLVPSSSPLKSLSEYLAYTKSNPGKVNYGTSGVGDISHLSAIWMHSIAGTKVTFVPYKGNAPMMADLVAGRVDVGSSSLVNALPQIRAGKLRALAVRGSRRASPLPEVPTVSEHPGMQEFTSDNWLGFFGPAGMPAPVTERLVTALKSVTTIPEVVAELESQASTPVGSTPVEFKAFVAQEIARWKKVVSEAGIQK